MVIYNSYTDVRTPSFSCGDACVQEAERLAETYAGAECMSVSAGPSRGAKPTAAFYLGRGAVAQLGNVIQEADPEK